jgi:ribonuclease J
VLDGDVILPADGGTINERRKLGQFGHISVGIAINGKGGVAGSPDVRVLGVPVEEDRDAFLEDAVEAARGAVAKARSRDIEAVREQVRLAVRRVATDWTGKKPIVDVTLVSV